VLLIPNTFATRAITHTNASLQLSSTV